MSREIEFRIYDKGRKEWVHGPGDEVNLFGETILCGELLRRDSDDTHVKLQDLNDMVALQYTGLKDKAGVEIYEGDIVRVLYTDWPSKSKDDPRPLDQYLDDISKIGEVVFEGFEWCIKFRHEKYGDEFGTFIVGRHGLITVIGSIYSNPELLQK